MALATSPHNSSMQITYHLGIDDDGKDKTISRSLTNIKSEETDENLLGLSTALSDYRNTRLLEYFVWTEQNSKRINL